MPIKALGGGHDRTERRRSMRRLRPADRLTIATREHQQALAARTSTEVARDQLPRFDLVPEPFQRANEAAPALTGALRIRHQELVTSRHLLANIRDAIVFLAGQRIDNDVE